MLQDQKYNYKIRYQSWIGRCVVFLLLAVFLNATAAAARQNILQQGIAEEVLRFHVLANSDNEEDQNVKIQVRDAVLEWMEKELETDSLPETSVTSAVIKGSCRTDQSDRSGRDAAVEFVSENLTQIEEIANAVLEKQGMSYRASAELTQSWFPDRTYGDCTFPAGWYEALRICLGEAEGQNWWCVLYPALCFSDCLHAVIEEDELIQLEDVLTVEEYESLLQSPGQWKISFRWFTVPS
ncbi:MAG: stage II sporulation protein R [Lachnospiraceae bacterium]|nr:stage II sporulation protein R [Lachnospiraceae bacterium]